MADKVVVLGACCAGKSTQHCVLPAMVGDDVVVVESDDAVVRAAGGTWPASQEEIRRLVIETGLEALRRARVVLLTSFLPTDVVHDARACGASVVLLDVPLTELERRNAQRMVEGTAGDESRWFAVQLAAYQELRSAGLVDHVIDGMQAIQTIADQLSSLAGVGHRRQGR